MRAGGTFSLTEFWSRRARRILPAATVVTVATVGVSLLWLSLIDAREVVTDALWATAFAANVHFARQGTDYFAADVGISPLQHYWSLAVEEQFYVVWPLLLLACLVLARWVTPAAARQQRHPRRAVVTMLLGGSPRRRSPGRSRRPAATRPRRTSRRSRAAGSSASAPSPRSSRRRSCAGSPTW